MYIVEESGTEMDEDVFSDVLEEKSDIVWTLTNASSVEGNISNTIKLDLSSLFHCKNTNNRINPLTLKKNGFKLTTTMTISNLQKKCPLSFTSYFH